VREATLEVGAEPFPGYRLVGLRGCGGFSQVWEATADDGSPVALKFMPSHDGPAAGLELRMIQALSELRHPGLIGVRQVWCQPGHVVVAMELAEGSLLDLLEAYQIEHGTPVEAGLLLDYLSQAADALDFLNARQHLYLGSRTGFQHCDVKPSNLLILGRRLKLADFGLAAATSTRLAPGRSAGSLDYAAPEVYRGQLSDTSDQFSLAVTYCHLRTGRLPFPEPPTRFLRSYVRPAPDLTLLSPPEKAVIRRALAPTPQDRWPNCGAFVYQLADLSGIEGCPLQVRA
jgi:serine/threonine protein kinase